MRSRWILNLIVVVGLSPVTVLASTCDTACCGPAKCGSWGARIGVEATFLKPDFKDSDVSYLIDDLGLGALDEVNGGLADAEYLGVAPRLSMGLVHCSGWGMRGRFWQLDQSDHGAQLFDPVLGENLGGSAVSSFEAYTIDLEATRDFCVRGWDMIGSFGARHAAIEYGQSATVNSIFDLGGGTFLTLPGNTSSLNRFDGTGLTLGLSGTRQVRYRCLNVFWNVRGSVVWGDARAAVQTYAGTGTPAGSAFSINGAIDDTDGDMFIGEAQVGFELSHRLNCLPYGRAFVRCAAEYQGWNSDDGFAAATSFAGVAGITRTQVIARAAGAEANLIGFTIGTGIEF